MKEQSNIYAVVFNRVNAESSAIISTKQNLTLVNDVKLSALV